MEQTIGAKIRELRKARGLTQKELGEMLDPPIGKSGVNHRLRKLSGIAEDLRQRQ